MRLRQSESGVRKQFRDVNDELGQRLDRGAARLRCWFVQSRRRSVMKTLSAGLALAVAVVVGAVPRATADAKAEQQAVGVVLAERIQDLNLTDEQEAKIADIRKEFRPRVQEAD
jgi:hypothetical protein